MRTLNLLNSLKTAIALTTIVVYPSIVLKIYTINLAQTNDKIWQLLCFILELKGQLNGKLYKSMLFKYNIKLQFVICLQTNLYAYII